ncbi:MAG: thioredoxin [Halobacteriales archaeon]|nr:thioredoxin [Halobacteriales archaeon]
MTLETLTPAEDWRPAGHREAVEALRALGEGDEILIWCDDGCGDCRALLPDFAAALAAADVPDGLVTEYAVERLPEGEKRGPRVAEYGIERIPTVVVERDGEAVARFVEGDVGPIADALGGQLAAATDAD